MSSKVSNLTFKFSHPTCQNMGFGLYKYITPSPYLYKETGSQSCHLCMVPGVGGGHHLVQLAQHRGVPNLHSKMFHSFFYLLFEQMADLSLSKYSSCTHVNICWCAPGWAARHWWGSWVSGTWTGGRRSWWTCLQCPGRRSPVPTQPLLSMLPRRLGASVSVCPHRQPSPASPAQPSQPSPANAIIQRLSFIFMQPTAPSHITNVHLYNWYLIDRIRSSKYLQ